nr:phospholipase D-like domain-containing protein [Vibrio parahaemolyticus]
MKNWKGTIKEDSPVNVEACFQEIRQRILESILQAKFSIWVAVAWFTDKEIVNALLNKHRDGLNIQVIVNDDSTTSKYGFDFSTKGIEYYKIAPSSPWGKKIMHNKFCVIDFKKVVQGSYNWTKNAQYNKESITITDSRGLAEDFAEQFIDLKQAHKSAHT